jgi:hypothetical protein
MFIRHSRLGNDLRTKIIKYWHEVTEHPKYHPLPRKCRFRIKFEVLVAMKMSKVIFCVIMLCGLVTVLPSCRKETTRSSETSVTT